MYNAQRPTFGTAPQHLMSSGGTMGNAMTSGVTGQVHPLVAALMQHLQNQQGAQGAPQTQAMNQSAAGNALGRLHAMGAGMGGGIMPNGNMNGTPTMGRGIAGQGLPAPNMGAVAQQFAPQAQGLANQAGTAGQQAAGLAGQMGGLSGMPMGAYGSFYGGMANQAAGQNAAAGMGGGMQPNPVMRRQ